MTTREGYQPTEKLDTSKPPQDTTGVPEMCFRTYQGVSEIRKVMKEIKDKKGGIDTPSNYPTKPLRSVKNPDTSGRECQ